MIEIMVVVAIVGILLTVAIPPIYRQLHPDSMLKAVNDMMEACSHARAHAILNSTITELIIRPGERTIRLGAVAYQAAPVDTLSTPDVAGNEWRMEERRSGSSSASESGNFSVKLSERIIIEGLGINGEDWTEEEEARVRFYPNGTSDQFSIILLSDKNERRNIWLEVVTGLPELEVDPNKFRAR